MTTTPTARRATIEDLYQVKERAELINGEIVPLMPTGFDPGRTSAIIFGFLFLHERSRGGGFAVPDNVAYRVSLPNRESFSPDASWYTGPRTGMKFAEGAPIFAAEVRSEGDYGEAAERDMAAKRRDYFAAGTLAVWDVDLQSKDVVRKYTAAAPEQPTVYGRGETADAEPAVPGWTMPVDDLFV